MDKIFVVGAGVEGLGGFSSRAMDLITKAGLLVGSQRQLDLFEDFPGEKILIQNNLEEISERLDKAECLAVVISSGDPLFFGIGRYLLRNLPRERLEFLPNVSSIQYAFSKIKVPWDDSVCVSVIDRDLRTEIDRIVSSDKVAVLTDQVNSPAVIARELMARGRDGYTAYLCENLGMENERIIITDLKELRQLKTASLNVLILVKEFEGQEETFIPLLGIPDREFRVPKNVLTQEEIRVLTLAKLRLRNDVTFWDIGAGSGSVSIEADKLLGNGRLFAIEKDPERLGVLKENLKKFNSRKIMVISGEAPDCLDDLPDPDRVFIGGAGGNLLDVLETIDQRLRPQGRIVINAVTLDTIVGTNEFFDKSGYQVELTAVNVSRTDPLTDYKIFEALNPVYIITAEKDLF